MVHKQQWEFCPKTTKRTIQFHLGFRHKKLCRGIKHYLAGKINLREIIQIHHVDLKRAKFVILKQLS